MADTKRNALAELANEIERFASENKNLFASRNHLVLHKAQRIVAELAQVAGCLHPAITPRGREVLCYDGSEVRHIIHTVARCREIAEEGAKDDEARNL